MTSERHRDIAEAQERTIADPAGSVAIFRERCFAALTLTPDDDALTLIPDTDLYQMCMSPEGFISIDICDLERLLDADLIQILRDIVAQPNFLRSSDDLTGPVLAVFTAFLTCIYKADDVALYHRVAEVLDQQPLLNLWDTRQLLLTHEERATIHQVFTPIMGALAIRGRISNAVNISSDLEYVSKREIRMAFFVWFHLAYDLDEAGVQIAGFLKAVPWLNDDLNALRKHVSSDHVLLDSLIDEHGEDGIIERVLMEIKWMLKSSLTAIDSLQRMPWLVVMLDLLRLIYDNRKGGRGFQSNPDVFTNLLELHHEIDQSLAKLDSTTPAIVRDCFEFDVGSPLAWDCALLVLRVVDDEYQDAESDIPGSFIILPLRTLGIMYLSAMYALSTPATPTTIEVLAEFLDKHSRARAPSKLRSLFKLIAHTDSWPEAWLRLDQLQRQFRGTTSAPAVQSIVDVWTDWTKAADIDPVEARANADTVKARRCSWGYCPQQGKLAKRPLPACRGCGEARYCSKNCQKSDWKQGD
ncbi:hypothetical protein PENSPDRAFT_751647, partial [Peniophora sp. CONT]